MSSPGTTLASAAPAIPAVQTGPPGIVQHQLGAGALRVLHVFDRLGTGGAESIVLRVVQGLPRDTFEHYVCPLRGADAEFADRTGPATLVNAPCGPCGFQFNLPRLVRLMRTIRPQIVHSRNWGGIEAVFAARLAGVPIVIHSEHGYEVNMLAGLPFRQRALRRLAYGMADTVFTVTGELRAYHAAQARIGPERIRVVQNGVDTGQFRPNASMRKMVREKLGISEDMFVIGSVGRIVAIKDHGTLLRAVAMLASKHPSVRAVVAGSGPYLSGLHEQTESTPELRGRVQFLGACDRVHEILNAMDVFVLSSLCEGMSNTLLEALATGLPVVATAVGGNPEVVVDGTCGYLFSPGDALSLSALLESLLCDVETRKSLSEAARRHATTNFGVQRMLERYRDLYLESAAAAGLLRNQNTYVRN